MAQKDEDVEAAPTKEGRRQAVIEEEESAQEVVLQRHSKGVKTTALLKSALRETDLLKALDITHIEEMLLNPESRNAIRLYRMTILIVMRFFLIFVNILMFF